MNWTGPHPAPAFVLVSENDTGWELGPLPPQEIMEMGADDKAKAGAFNSHGFEGDGDAEGVTEGLNVTDGVRLNDAGVEETEGVALAVRPHSASTS